MTTGLLGIYSDEKVENQSNHSSVFPDAIPHLWGDESRSAEGQVYFRQMLWEILDGQSKFTSYVREGVKYYFADFVRKGGTPPPFTDIFLLKNA